MSQAASICGQGGAAHALGRQLASPSGIAGSIVGVAMGLLNARPTRLVIDAAEISADHHVLDAGCGGGQALALVAPRCAHACGFDASPLMVEQARARNRHAIAAGRVYIQRGRFDDVPFPSGSFDRIIAANVAYFWTDFGKVMAEFARLLRPGGRVAIYVTAAESMRNWRFAQTGTHRLFDRASLAAALAPHCGDAFHLDVDQAAVTRRISGIIATLDRIDARAGPAGK